MKTRIVVGILATLFVASSLSAGVLPGQLRIEKLKNGLTVVMVPTAKEGMVSFYSLVRTGSRDETDARHTGFAHLFEHMMFRGTKRFPKEAYEAKIQELGADNNAFTGSDLTCFTVSAPTAALPHIIDLEADRFQNLSYSEADYKTETGAVLGEYNMATASPGLPLYEALLTTAFKAHTYGHTTLGFVDDIKAMPGYYKYSTDFYKRFYRPDNTTLIVTGAFDPTATLAQIDKAYGKWKGKRVATKVKPEPVQTEPRTVHVSWKGETSHRMLVGYKIPAFRPGPDSAALEVASHLAFGETSPLYRKLVLEERKLLSLHASSGLAEHLSRDPFLFIVDATLAQGTSFDEIRAAIDGAVAELASAKVEPARFSAVRNHVRSAFALGLETSNDTALALAILMSATFDPQALEKWVDAVSAVTEKDVQKAAQQFLTAQRRTVATLSTAGEKGGAK
ncbi:MAG: insulinase family protein [Myxococcota bacterium]|jgi:zinc protease|nr:insulinase family protein [Myxococcota bacterium]